MLITIILPEDAQLMAEMGKKIVQGDPLYRTKRGKSFNIEVARSLKIRPSTIFTVLTKGVGEKVKKNEMIASKKGLISARSIRADQDGVIEKIDHVAGTVTMCIDNDKDAVVQSFFTGIIKKTENNRLTIDIEKGIVVELEMITIDWGGPAFYLTDEDRYFSMNEEDIKNKTVITQCLTPPIQVKCEALAAAGFILRVAGSAIAKKDHHISLPHAIFKNPQDWDRIVSSKKPYILCSVVDRTAILYE